MVDEAKKTQRVRGTEFIKTYFSGTVVDIGCGPDLVVPHARAFDREHGDAERVLDYLPPAGSIPFTARTALSTCGMSLAPWRNGGRSYAPHGHLVVVVPLEDLYEQG